MGKKTKTDGNNPIGFVVDYTILTINWFIAQFNFQFAVYYTNFPIKLVYRAILSIKLLLIIQFCPTICGQVDYNNLWCAVQFTYQVVV